MITEMNQSGEVGMGLPASQPADLLFYTNAYLSGIIIATVSLFGILANFVSVIVFVRQRLQDSVSVALISLSASDCGVTFASLGISACYIWKFIDPEASGDSDSVMYVAFYWQYSMLYDVSAGTTVLISLERCLCVVAPMRVKSIVTPSRMFMALIVVWTYKISITIPVFVTQGLIRIEDSRNHNNKFSLWFTKDRPLVENFSFLANMAFVFVAEVVVCSSSFGMAWGLRTAAKVRKGMSGKCSSKEAHASRLSKQEAKLVKMILLVAIFFCVSHSALMCLVLFYVWAIGGQGSHVFQICSAFGKLLSVVNATCNSLVYFNVSSKYRRDFLRLFGACCLTDMTRKGSKEVNRSFDS